MTITVRGIIGEEPATLQWSPNAGLSGHPIARARAEALVRFGSTVTEVAAHYRGPAALSSSAQPAAVFATLCAAMTAVTSHAGYEPDELPEGAIS